MQNTNKDNDPNYKSDYDKFVEEQEKKNWLTAKHFNDLYERLAPTYGYTTREDTKDFDPESPNGKLMTEVCNTFLANQRSEIEKLKRGKHNSKCEHDNNWCITHAEELIDDEYEEYGYNCGIDAVLALLNSKDNIK